MKEVIREYGNICIAGVILCTLLILLAGVSWNGKTGMNRIAGEVIREQTTRQMNEKEHLQAMHGFYSQCGVLVEFVENETIYPSETLSCKEALSPLLLVKSKSEEVLDWEIISVKNESNEDMATFLCPGIYTVTIAVRSPMKEEYQVKFDLPVQEEELE